MDSVSVLRRRGSRAAKCLHTPREVGRRGRSTPRARRRRHLQREPPQLIGRHATSVVAVTRTREVGDEVVVRKRGSTKGFVRDRGLDPIQPRAQILAVGARCREGCADGYGSASVVETGGCDSIWRNLFVKCSFRFFFFPLVGGCPRGKRPSCERERIGQKDAGRARAVCRVAAVLRRCDL